MQLPPLGLYVHLPWCERKCPYCDFNSHEYEVLPEREYVDALLRDLEQDARLAQGRPIETVFIGGGTPSLFSGTEVGRLLRGIASRASLLVDAEITMEANPGSSEAQKFAAFRDAGVNRLSVGVQSFNDDCLHALGRIHSGADAQAAIEHARKAGFENINIDLMHGLPAQSTADARDDLRRAIACEPTHLSWYQLTIEPNTAFHNRPPRLPVEDELADIQSAGERELTHCNYQQYEVSAFCRPGWRCQHNLNYWRFGDYLGIGAGAHGKITFPNGQIQRYAKTRQPKSYLSAEAGRQLTRREPLSPADTLGEFMLNALRLNEGFTLAQFRARTGQSTALLEQKMESPRERGLLTVEGTRITASSLGKRFLNDLVAEFF